MPVRRPSSKLERGRQRNESREQQKQQYSCFGSHNVNGKYCAYRSYKRDSVVIGLVVRTLNRLLHCGTVPLSREMFVYKVDEIMSRQSGRCCTASRSKSWRA